MYRYAHGSAALQATLTGPRRPSAACVADASKRSSDFSHRSRLVRGRAPPTCSKPNLKEGAGGRRDFDELTWSAALVTGRAQHGPAARWGAEP